jgi:RNA recognition motif-containing protein
MAELLAKKEITVETKVWSSHIKTWEPMNELPYFVAALEACADQQAPVDIAKEDASYDASIMTFDANKDSEPPIDVHDELEAFLSTNAAAGHDDEEDEEGYESDGGTLYVKDARTGNWIHADYLASQKRPTLQRAANRQETGEQPTKVIASKKRKKPKFSAKNAKCWVYVQGLPPDTNEAQLQQVFSKMGIIELDPETQRPKIKLYKHKDDGPNAGTLKGDASICYARPESVELALQLLDEAPYRPLELGAASAVTIRVSRAKFEQHGGTFEKKPPVSNAKRKVAKLAAIQAIGWDEGDNGRITGGRKGLRIIVLKHMFQPSDLDNNNDEDAFLHKLEQKIRTECEQWGVVEKITIFSKHSEGVIIVKFTQPTAASTAVTEFNGRELNGRRIEAIFWDGVTDYTVRNEEKEKKESEQRQEEFGKWLESQDVPEEFRLHVEGTSS